MAEPGTMPRVLLDRYELRDQVGVGGMGEVWLGWDRRLQRDVAVKLLLPQLSDEPAFRQRFEVEARAAAALEHPNVVRVFDIDEDRGSLFIVMERLPGPSLDRRIYEGPLSEDEVMRVAADMLAGLGAAHAENLVHRDIKPGNLIRSAGGRWKVGDFGVAKDLASTAHLTLVGVAVGTPAYLAPEQLDGRPATSATDLWAAGVVLREALTGRRPFDGNDPIEVAHAVQSTVVPPLLTVRPDISPALAAAIDRSLSFDPRQRFTTAQGMLDAIEGKPPVVAALPSVDDVPAPPPSVSGEVAPLPDPSTSGPAPVVPPVAGPPDPAPRSHGRTIAIAAIVAGVVLLLFLLGLLFGLVMLGDDTDDDAEVPPATTEPDDTDEAPAADVPTTTAPPTTAADGLLPGDGPLPGQAPPPEDAPGDSADPGGGAGEGEGVAPGEGEGVAPGEGGPGTTDAPKPDETVPDETVPGDLGEGAFGAQAGLGVADPPP